MLVTCTNGELGDAPGGTKPEAAEHDVDLVVKTRLEELRRSCEILSITHLELLGYKDSGMMGWTQNDDPRSFWKTPLDYAAARVATLIEKYRPAVIVTYDENGFYGHPDHIQAHRAAVQATRETGIPKKLYYTAVSKQDIARVSKIISELMPERANDWQFDPENPPFGCDESEITTRVDVSSVVKLKRESMNAHASQSDVSDFLSMPQEMFEMMFSEETFSRAFDATNAELPESDLFAGLR
ncbi:MAG: PIG-L family deacetylase [Actinomycetota bacterium]